MKMPELKWLTRETRVSLNFTFLRPQWIKMMLNELLKKKSVKLNELK